MALLSRACMFGLFSGCAVAGPPLCGAIRESISPQIPGVANPIGAGMNPSTHLFHRGPNRPPAMSNTDVGVPNNLDQKLGLVVLT